MFFTTVRGASLLGMGTARSGNKYAGGLNGAVAAVLRGEKAMRGMSVDDVRKASGLPYESTRRYLAGERAIDVDVLEQLASAFGYTASEIIARGQERLAAQAAHQAAGPAAGQTAGQTAAKVRSAVRDNPALKRAVSRKKAAAAADAAESQHVAKMKSETA